MNFIVVPLTSFHDKEVVITSEETLTHVHQVLKSQVGDRLKLVVLNEGTGDGEILELSKNKLIIGDLKLSQGKARNISIAVGLCRPLMTQRILEHATTMGVDQFLFFHAELSEKSYAEAKVFNSAETEKRLVNGLAQTGLFDQLPRVQIINSLKQLPLADFDKVYFLDGSEEKFLSLDSKMSEKKVLFILGPERGFTTNEVQFLKDKSISGIKISESTQRVEFAIHGILSQVEWINNYANC